MLRLRQSASWYRSRRTAKRQCGPRRPRQLQRPPLEHGRFVQMESQLRRTGHRRQRLSPGMGRRFRIACPCLSRLPSGPAGPVCLMLPPLPPTGRKCVPVPGPPTAVRRPRCRPGPCRRNLRTPCRRTPVHLARMRAELRQPHPERPLMYPAGVTPHEEWENIAWPTPTSMRNVDVSCEAGIIRRYEEGI